MSGAGISRIVQNGIPFYAYANGAPAQTAPGNFDLAIAKKRIKVGRSRGRGVTVSGGIPGPLARTERYQ